MNSHHFGKEMRGQFQNTEAGQTILLVLLNKAMAVAANRGMSLLMLRFGGLHRVGTTDGEADCQGAWHALATHPARD